MWPGTESNCRHEDFQFSCRSGTMCHHRSLLVSIQVFNAPSSGRFYRFEHIDTDSSFKAHSKQRVIFEARLLFLRPWKVYVRHSFRHKRSTARGDAKGTSVRKNE